MFYTIDDMKRILRAALVEARLKDYPIYTISYEPAGGARTEALAIGDLKEVVVYPVRMTVISHGPEAIIDPEGREDGWSVDYATTIQVKSEHGEPEGLLPYTENLMSSLGPWGVAAKAVCEIVRLNLLDYLASNDIEGVPTFDPFSEEDMPALNDGKIRAQAIKVIFRKELGI